MRAALVVSLVFIALPNPATAGSLRFDFRTDWDTAQYNEANKNFGRYDSSAIQIQTGRIDYQGTLNDELSYRTRISFNNYRTNDGVDKLAPNVDLAYITHKMNWLALTVGKFQTDVSTHETFQPPPEVYFKSEALRAITENYLLGGTTATNGTAFFLPIKFSTGVRLGASFGDHDFSVLALNNPEGDNAATANVGGQDKMVYGVAWKGKFLDKRLTPAASYHTASLGGDTSTTAADRAKVNYYVGGIKFEEPHFFVQLDYAHLTSGPVTVATVDNDAQIDSLVLEGGRRFDKLLVRLKAETSTVTLSPSGGTETKQDIIGAGAALEYRPWEGQDFRYHIAYTQKWIDETAAAKKEETHIIAGLRILADFLK